MNCLIQRENKRRDWSSSFSLSLLDQRDSFDFQDLINCSSLTRYPILYEFLSFFQITYANRNENKLFIRFSLSYPYPSGLHSIPFSSSAVFRALNSLVQSIMHVFFHPSIFPSSHHPLFLSRSLAGNSPLCLNSFLFCPAPYIEAMAFGACLWTLRGSD